MEPGPDTALLARLAGAPADIPIGSVVVARLRPPNLADAAPFVLACNDADIRDLTEVPTPYDHQHAAQFIQRQVPAGRQDGSVVAFVAADSDNEVLGVVSLHRIQAAGSAEVGYWTAPWARRRGVATAALGALADWAFDEVGLRRLTWRAVVGNVGSLRAATGAGFVPEGTLHRALRHRDAYVDCWHASLTATGRGHTDEVRAGCAVEIAAGAWQLQPIVSRADALMAEAALPVSACLPKGLWAVRHAVTGTAAAVIALLATADRGWVLASPAEGGSPDGAADAGRAAVERYARRALELQLP